MVTMQSEDVEAFGVQCRERHGPARVQVWLGLSTENVGCVGATYAGQQPPSLVCDVNSTSVKSLKPLANDNTT
jgi:hypothetical protein